MMASLIPMALVVLIALIGLVLIIAVVRGERTQVLVVAGGGARPGLLERWVPAGGRSAPGPCHRAYLDLMDTVETVLIRLALLPRNNPLSRTIEEKAVKLARISSRQMEWAADLNQALKSLGDDGGPGPGAAALAREYREQLDGLALRLAATDRTMRRLLLKIDAVYGAAGTGMDESGAIMEEMAGCIGALEEVQAEIHYSRRAMAAAGKEMRL
ncbi:MAG TPA: hypothetical protein VM658_05005 [bacterium]|nr:hypothetical protein [bacterium]